MMYRWDELTSPELAALAERRPVAAVVLGAVEQHGPHLPLGTDSFIGEGLLAAAAQRLAEDFLLLALPTLAIGASTEHKGFPGTLALSAIQMQRQIAAIGDGLSRTGVTRLVLVNAHGGNIGWMDDAALELRRCHAMLVVKASYMRFQAPADLLGADELRNGLHGGLAETAMMRHLAPALVRMDRAEHFVTRHPHDASLPPQGEAPWAWLAEDLHPAGVVGDAASASAELGRKLIDHYAARLADVLEQCRSKDWPPARNR